MNHDDKNYHQQIYYISWPISDLDKSLSHHFDHLSPLRRQLRTYFFGGAKNDVEKRRSFDDDDGQRETFGRQRPCLGVVWHARARA